MNQLLPIGLKTSLKRHSVPIRFGLPTSFIFRARKKVGFIWPLKWICAPSESRAGSWTIRWPSAPALHHSDRGVQYAAKDFPQTLKIYDVSPSMSRKACCYDNAAMESFFATLKTECFQNRIPKNRAQAQAMLFDYIETFYNPKRLHSSLGYLSPLEFENFLHQQNLINN